MVETAGRQRTAVIVPHNESTADELRRLIEHAAHLLPTQGPLSVFIHQNTLHAFEDLAFVDAVPSGAELYGCKPYLDEQQYRKELARGRIRREDLVAVLLDDLENEADEQVGPLGTRFHLRMAMLEHPVRSAASAELRWIVAETDALRTFRDDAPAEYRSRMIESTRRWIMRDFRNGKAASTKAPAAEVTRAIAELLDAFGKHNIDAWSEAAWESFCLQALWRICSQGVKNVLSDEQPPARTVRPRDWLLEATGEDADELVHELLIRLSAVFLDQGFAHWTLPNRDDGIWTSILQLYSRPGGVRPRWLAGFSKELRRLIDDSVTPLESIEESLNLLGVDQPQRESFIAASLLALRGWAGMIWQMETNAEWTVHPAPPGSLIEFTAVRLLLDRFAAAHIASERLGNSGPLRDISPALAGQAVEDETDGVPRAFVFFQLAQLLGIRSEDLYQLPVSTWSRLAKEIDSFSELERRRTFHLAYERRYRNQTLDAIAIHAGRRAEAPKNVEEEAPTFQIICCLDEREESFRRHLEEIEPRCETLSFAGFFAIAMYYRGAADAHARPLCPVVIKPRHYVEEHPVYTEAESHRRRAHTRRIIGAASHHVHHGSRALVGGAIAALLGSLASAPLVARILFPRLAARLRRSFDRIVDPPPTQLLLERTQPDPGPEDGHIGYTVAEMTDVVERVLRDTGLTSRMAPLVIMCGHGSSSLNNPHESAHDCGACGGGRGGPNARAFAQMANDPRVRSRLTDRELQIPDETTFVGAYHNTCDDAVTYYDLDRLPLTHVPAFEHAKRALDEARQRNAHERCRRFESAPLSLTFEMALRHVEARAEDLAQVRPEYGHATNAVCFVGRRSRTKGLFLDRRTFLTSYDPTQDDERRTILTRILQPVVPVCGGINLEYFFSFTDSTGYGCGTKLPHNITSLLGVMDGATSDLRPGLPWQMVEVHEPVRLLFVIETTPEAMLEIFNREPAIAAWCLNHWVQLATLDPESNRIDLFQRGAFCPYEQETDELPEVACSADWYRGWRDHLGYARVKG